MTSVSPVTRPGPAATALGDLDSARSALRGAVGLARRHGTPRVERDAAAALGSLR